MTEESAATVAVTGHAQHAAWLSRTLPPSEELAPDLWSIPVPMPNNPLRYVSVYVLAGDSKLILIDTGVDEDESWRALSAGLDSFGASASDVTGVLVTHQHFDHIGLARRLQEVSGAWVGLHPADRDQIMNPEFRDPVRGADNDVRWLIFLGAPEEEARRLGGTSELTRRRSTFAVPDRLIEDDQEIRIPGWCLRAIHTPGHTPGHLCFVDHGRGLLFAGDHLLPRISPNVAADRRAGQDALAAYLDSLDKISSYDGVEVLPAHEWRFRGVAGRARQLAAHHEARLSELLHVIRDHPGRTSWELAAHLTWSRSWDQYDGRMRVSAVSETMAHIVYLLNRGLITASCTPVPSYRVTTRHGVDQ